MFALSKSKRGLLLDEQMDIQNEIIGWFVIQLTMILIHEEFNFTLCLYY